MYSKAKRAGAGNPTALGSASADSVPKRSVAAVRLGGFRIPLPKFLMGCPLVREWQDADGTLHIRVEIHNTLLGRFFGYEGVYSRVR